MGCPNASVARRLTVSVYAVDGSRGRSGRISNWPRARGLPTTRSPVTAGVSETAAATADGDIARENESTIGESRGVVAPSEGVAEVSTGAAALVRFQMWSRALTLPFTEVMPAPRSKLYSLLGKKRAPGWWKTNPDSPESQVIQQGAPGRAVNAAATLQPGSPAFGASVSYTLRWAATLSCVTGWSKTTSTVALASSWVEPAGGLSWTICGGALKHPVRRTEGARIARPRGRARSRSACRRGLNTRGTVRSPRRAAPRNRSRSSPRSGPSCPSRSWPLRWSPC